MGYVAADRREALKKTGCGAVFESNTIVTPSEAVQDDLMRAFADETGVAANLHLTSFSSWFGDSLGPVLMGRGNSAEELEWMIWSLLGDDKFLSQSECSRLKHYVQGQPASVVAALARRITHLFVTYVSYRLDWVLGWMDETYQKDQKATPRLVREKKVLEAHADFAWQKALFKEVATRRWGVNHERWSSTRELFAVPMRWKKLMQMDASEKHAPVHLFMPLGIPPLALPFLQALSRTRNIYVYLMNPCEAYWFEAISQKAFTHWDQSQDGQALSYLRRNAAAQRALIERLWTFASDPETDAAFVEDDAPERVVDAACGRRMNKEEMKLDVAALENLRASDAADQEQVTAFIHRDNPQTVLHQLQEAVLSDDASCLPKKVSEDDDSFLIVKAPNAAREIEAVLDWVDALKQKATARGQTFGAEDVLVVTPDIDAMAPVISSVLMNRSDDKRVAYHIAGQTVLSVNSVAQAVLQTGRFVFSKAEKSEFESLLDYPILFHAWGCDETTGVVLRRWLDASGYRWGLNEKHAHKCVESGLAEAEGSDFEATLERALERLNLGARLRDDQRDVYAGELAVFGKEAGGFETVAGNKPLFDFLCSLVMTLGRLSEVPRRQSASAWFKWTQDLVAQVFPGVAEDADAVQFIRTAERIALAADAVLADTPLEFEAFWGTISSVMKTDKTMTRASGRITFAGMQDFRNLPFKAVAIVGLNDGPTFPGVVRCEEFDLMAAKTVDVDGSELVAKRKGDRDARQNNRNVFLDLILAARSHLLVSYTTGTGKIEQCPSVVLQDLKALLADGLGDEGEVERSLTVKLPSSAFAEENFDVSAKSVQSRNRTRLAALSEARRTNFLGSIPRFMNTEIVVKPQEGERRSLALGDLTRVIQKSDEWTSKVVGVRILKNEASETDQWRNPIASALTASNVRIDIMQRLERGQTKEEILQTYALDTQMGLAGLRTTLLADILNECVLMQQIKERLLCNSLAQERLEAVVMSVDGAAGKAFDSILMPAVDVFQIEDVGATAFSLAASKSAQFRAFLQFLGRAAVTPECDMYVVTPGKEKMPMVMRWQLPKKFQDGQEIRELFKHLMRLINQHAAGPLLLAEKPYESWSSNDQTTVFNPLWQGDDAYELLKNATKDLEDALKALSEYLRVPLTEKEKAVIGLELDVESGPGFNEESWNKAYEEFVGKVTVLETQYAQRV